MTDPVTVCPNCTRSFSSRFKVCPHCAWRVQSASGSNLPRIRDDARITAVDHRAPADRHALELPPDDDEAPPPVPLTLPPDPDDPPPLLGAQAPTRELSPSEEPLPPTVRASAPRPFEPSLTPLGNALMPDWLEEPLEPSSRWALSLVAALFLMLSVESLTVGELQAGAIIRGSVLLLLLAGGVALARLHRLGVLAGGLAGLGVSVVAGLSGQLVAAIALAGWTVAMLGVTLTKRLGLSLGVGSLCLVTAAPCLLDGASSRPLFGAVIAATRPKPLRAPFVDQRTGLQLAEASDHLTVRETAAAGLTLEDPTLGAQLALLRLSPGALPPAAREEVEQWLSARSLSRVSWGDETRAPGSFDTAVTVAFTAKRGRQDVIGRARIAHLGTEGFAVLAWSRAHRWDRLAEKLVRVVETAHYRPPARPTLSTDQRATVRGALVTAADTTGVRLDVGGRTVLVIGAAVPRAPVRCATDSGPFEVNFGQATVAGSAVVIALGGGVGRPLASAAKAPRLYRIVVMTRDAMAGGWLTDDPGAPERRVDVQGQLDGPAFDAQGTFLGLVHDRGTRLTTTDTLLPTLTVVGGSAPALVEAQVEVPAPLYSISDEEPRAAPLLDLRASVLQVRTSAGLTGAAVFAASESSWGLLADVSVVPANATSVAVRLPSEEVVAAAVGRTSGRAVLLVLPRDASPELEVLPLVEGAAVEGRRQVWGFREDAIAGDALKSIDGTLTADGFEPDPGPAPTGGPVVTPDGRLAGLMVRGSQRIVDVETVAALRAPALKDVVWRIRAEPSGHCQLAVDAELDDPLREAKLLLLRLAPAASETPPARLVSAAFVETQVSGPSLALTRQYDCLTSPQWMQFEVQSPSGNAITTVRRLRPPTTLPEIIRGRSGPSKGALPPSAALTLQLWSVPSPVTHVHPCRARPELCERACAIEEADACVVEGASALAKKELTRAIARLDPGCATGDVESCILLSFALVEKRPKGLRSKPEEVLDPWCKAGVARACAALSAKGWLSTREALTARCTSRPSECGAAARHLLEGPATDRDVERALKWLRTACGTGDQTACAAASSEAIRLGVEELPVALRRAARACGRGVAEGCVLDAMNFALGVSQPKTARGAEQALDEACRLGSREACEMTSRD